MAFQTLKSKTRALLPLIIEEGPASIHLSMCPLAFQSFIYPPTHLLIHNLQLIYLYSYYSSTNISLPLATQLLVCSSTYPSIHPSTHQSIHPPIHPLSNPSTHSSTNHPFIHSATHLPTHSPTAYSSIHPSIHSFAHPSDLKHLLSSRHHYFNDKQPQVSPYPQGVP